MTAFQRPPMTSSAVETAQLRQDGATTSSSRAFQVSSVIPTQKIVRTSQRYGCMGG
jgi:hypothetical protein